MKFANPVGFEACDLSSRRAIERLHPDVVHAFVCDQIGDRFSIGREFCQTRDALVDIE